MLKKLGLVLHLKNEQPPPLDHEMSPGYPILCLLDMTRAMKSTLSIVLLRKKIS